MYFYVSGYLLLGIAGRNKDVFGRNKEIFGETWPDNAIKLKVPECTM
jgi:hypothetical protein